MYDYLADYGFVHSLWQESLDEEVGPARRFAEAHSRSSFAISIHTGIRLIASSGVENEEAVERLLQAFPVVPFHPSILARAGAIFRQSDISIELAIEAAIAKTQNMKILTDDPERFSAFPGLTVVCFTEEE